MLVPHIMVSGSTCLSAADGKFNESKFGLSVCCLPPPCRHVLVGEMVSLSIPLARTQPRRSGMILSAVRRLRTDLSSLELWLTSRPMALYKLLKVFTNVPFVFFCYLLLLCCSFLFLSIGH